MATFMFILSFLIVARGIALQYVGTIAPATMKILGYSIEYQHLMMFVGFGMYVFFGQMIFS